jgi:hypothetical protein
VHALVQSDRDHIEAATDAAWQSFYASRLVEWLGAT